MNTLIIKTNKNRLHFTLALLVAFLFSIIVLDRNNSLFIFVMSWIVIFILIMRLIDFKQLFGTHINSFSFFTIAFFLYSFGKSLLFSFGLIDINELAGDFSLSLINKYFLFAVPSFYVFTSAATFVKIPSYSENNHLDDTINDYYDKVVFILYLVLLVISLVPYWQEVIFYIITARTKGYAAIFENSISAGFLTNFKIMYIPVLIFLISNKKNSIFLKYVFIALIAIPAVLFLLCGSRAKAMSLLLVLMFIWISDISKSKRKGKYIILIGILGFFMLSIFSAIFDLRQNASTNTFDAIVNVVFKKGIYDSVLSTIKEIGGTMNATMNVFNIVPSQYNYRYGYSYLAAVLACIPSVLTGHSFADDAALDVWLTNVNHANYGLGFSTFGESYCNFGWLGIIFDFFVGIFIFSALSGTWGGEKLRKYQNSIRAVALFIFVNTARNPIALSIRYILYGLLIPIFLFYLITGIKRVKKRS